MIVAVVQHWMTAVSAVVMVMTVMIVPVYQMAIVGRVIAAV